MLVCGDVIRPGLAWMLTRTHRYLASAMAQIGIPAGSLGCARWPRPSRPVPGRTPGSRTPVSRPCWPARAAASPASPSATAWNSSTCNAGCTREAGKKKVDFYLRLRALGVFPEDAPATIRAFGLAAGRLSIKELVDRYRLECAPVRDLIVDYLRERQPSLDFASLDAISRTLAGLFWAEIEALCPGIDSLRLPPDVARTWKENLKTKRRTTNAAGELIEVCSPRLNAKDELLRVRAFYLDIAQWAVDDPARWGTWATPCPISNAEISRAKERKHRKARMDQRTRERLPVLPVLVRTANERRTATAQRLRAARRPSQER